MSSTRCQYPEACAEYSNVTLQPNIPLIYASGRTNKGYPYIIMQMLGKNLTDLRKKRAEKRFTPSTAFRVAEQVSSTYLRITFIGIIPSLGPLASATKQQAECQC